MNKDALRKLLVSGIFLIPLIALINIGPLAFPFVTGKAFVFRILIELLFGIWILLVIAEKKYRPKLNWLSGTILAFLVALTIADIFSVNPLKSILGNLERMDGLVNMLHMVAYFFIVGTIIDTEKLWTRLFNTTIGVSVILSLLGLVQLAGGMTIYTADGRLDSTIGNAAYFALYLLIHIFIAIFMFAKRPGRYLYIAVVILHMIVLYFTATRSAFLGLFGGIFIAAVLVTIFAREQKKLRAVAITAIAIILLVIGGFFAIRNQSFVRNNPILNRFNAISIEGIKDQSRYYIWTMAIQGAKDYPVLGWGQENFNIVSNKYYQPALYNEDVNFDRAHNIILDWLIAGGALGLIAYLLIYVATIYYIWSPKWTRPLGVSAWTATEKSILTGLIVGYFINNLFIFDNITSYILFFTVLAYVYSKVKTASDMTTAEIAASGRELKKERQKESTKRDFIGIFIVPTTVAVLVVVYLVNMNGLSAAYYLGQAGDINQFKEALAQRSFGNEEVRQRLVISVIDAKSSSDLDSDAKQRIFELASTEIGEQIKSLPADSYNYYLAGSLMYAYDKYDEALTMLVKARELSPNKQSILSKIADVYIAKKDYKDAFSMAKYSFELEPRYDVARMTYAIATMLSGIGSTGATNSVGAMSAASSILKERFGTDIIFDVALMHAYEATGQIDKLVAIYEERIQKQPDDIQSIVSLAACYLKLGERDKAIKMLEDAKEKSTDYKDRIQSWIDEIRAGR